MKDVEALHDEMTGKARQAGVFNGEGPGEQGPARTRPLRIVGRPLACSLACLLEVSAQVSALSSQREQPAQGRCPLARSQLGSR